jgi:TnpA family transposase
MPGTFLTLTERARLSGFPDEIPSDDMFTFFTLSERDMEQVPFKSADCNRLGFALQLCALRYLGFCPDDLTTAPLSAVSYVAEQIDADAGALTAYAQREQTRTDHLQKIMDYLSYRKTTPEDLELLSGWLMERALEHSKPILLFYMVCERLYAEKIIRPGVTTIERMVVTAKQQAHEVTYQRLSSLFTDGQRAFLDNLLISDVATGRTPLFWLRREATSNTPGFILKTIEKLVFLRQKGVEDWDLSCINPNRQKSLAQIGRKSTNQVLQRLAPQQRYPILIAFLRQSLEDVIDELVDLFDRCLAECNSRSKRSLEEFQLSIARTTNEKLMTFRELGRIVLDPDIPDSRLREVIYTQVSQEELRSSVEECEKLIRPKDDKCYDFLANRYAFIRRFAPEFLDALHFRSNTEDDPLIEALEMLRDLNRTGKRNIPDDAVLDFVPKSWLPYVIDKTGTLVRRYYEICALWELRNALRSGNIWIDNSRRYADPETYLIPREQWCSFRSEACALLGVPEDGASRVFDRHKNLEAALSEFDRSLPHNSQVRIEKGSLIVSALTAEALPESTKELQGLITERIPRVELADLLIEVDSWTHFTDCFEHAGVSHPKTRDLLVHLYASIMAQACNFGLEKMADISSLSYGNLAWYTNWYIREETLQEANDVLVNFQYNQPLSRVWGGGTLSSSDGQRFPVPVKARNATALPKYFGYGRGLTFYSWTSDQFSQYGSRVIPATVRDATYVLDAILDNETELEIVEHTTDTAGYTELVFALFDVLGMQFSPRIRDIGEQRVYRADKAHKYRYIEPILSSTINRDLIIKHWDDILRVAASIKFGWVTASLFISKLQAYPRKNIITRAYQEYGRLIKSIYIPNYLRSEEDMRRVNLQLNKGEWLHDLRKFLLFAHEGQIRKSQIKDQINQASCLTLFTNAVIVWNTRYIQAAVKQLQSEGYEVKNSDLSHISPCRFRHINKYGKYSFNVEEEMDRKELRPLQKP